MISLRCRTPETGSYLKGERTRWVEIKNRHYTRSSVGTNFSRKERASQPGGSRWVTCGAKLRNREIEGLRKERNTLKQTKTKMAQRGGRAEDPATRSALLEKTLQELSNEAKTFYRGSREPH